jgi:hypothetical protein
VLLYDNNIMDVLVLSKPNHLLPGNFAVDSLFMSTAAIPTKLPSAEMSHSVAALTYGYGRQSSLDSPVEDSRFEPLVPLGERRCPSSPSDRPSAPLSRGNLVTPTRGGTGSSNPSCSTGESASVDPLGGPGRAIVFNRRAPAT